MYSSFNHVTFDLKVMWKLDHSLHFGQTLVEFKRTDLVLRHYLSIECVCMGKSGSQLDAPFLGCLEL